MGCINSTKKLADIKFENGRSDNVYRVRVIRLLNDTSAIRNGFLELTPKELIFSTNGRDPIIWSLQHLRRYGINGDIFSFEAGRRCTTGPGVYVFRCQQAESLYSRFQLHVNSVSNDDHAFSTNTLPLSSHQSIEINQQSNNYLVPAPLSLGFRERGETVIESHSLSSSELNIESPVSIAGSSFNNEMIHFQGQHQTPANTYQISNLYQEFPFNNNNRKLLIKRMSLDMPPADKAPGFNRMDNGSNSSHMYENIGTSPTATDTLIKNVHDELSDRCYENFSSVELPLLLQIPPSSKQVLQKKNNESVEGAMNYIVLDLDSTNKTPIHSPKNFATCNNDTLSPSTLGGTYFGTESFDDSSSLLKHNTNPKVHDTYKNTLTENDSANDFHINPTTESSLGYSTIDFIKTCALIKSSTYGSEFDQEESRITRHSKCVRKAFSISE